MMSPDLMWEILIFTDNVIDIREKANLHMQYDTD